MERILKICFFTALILAIPAGARAESWDANVRISAPACSYEGHSIELVDASLYHLGSSSDERSFSSAKEAADQGCISSSWQGTYTVLDRTYSDSQAILSQKVKYDKAGSYEISLSSLWLAGDQAGQSQSCCHSIDIKACPAVDSISLGGAQRAYQRQSIAVRLAQHPDFPIDTGSIQLVLTDSGGNKISWCKAVSISAEDTGEFINCSMEFLTKNQSSEQFIITVYAKDSRYRSLSYQYSFTVARDLAPQASINIARSFYRSEGGGAASVKAEFNGTMTDDAVSLIWDFPSYAKNCTYTGNSASFELSSPGWYSLKVTAKDTWADTLDEFINEDERKTASYTVKFKVENKAPKLKTEFDPVSLELLLVNSDSAKEAELKSDLIDLNINADIYAADISKDESPGSFNKTGNTSFSSSALLDCNDTWEKLISCDDKYAFYFYTATVSGTTVSGPYYIKRIDLKTGESCSFSYGTDSFGSIAKSAAVKLGYDLQGKFLYLIFGSKTYLIDKETGSITCCVDMALACCNSVYGGFVYSFCDTGIFKISLSDGSINLLYECQCLASDSQSARIKYGSVYLAVKKDESVFFCCFRPESESISLTKLYDNAGTDYLLAITPACSVYLAARDGGGSASANVKAFDINGKQIGNTVTVSLSAYFINYPQYCGIWPVFDKSGEVNYIYSPTVTLLNKAITVTLYGLYDGYKETTSTGLKDKSKGSGLGTDFRKCNLAIELDDGTVIVATGAGYYSSMKKSYCNCYYFKTQESALASITSPYIYSEWGFHWNEYWVSAYNLSGAGQINIYKYSEGFDIQLLRKEYELLTGSADYKYVCEDEDADAKAIAKALGISTTPGVFTSPVRHYKLGETVKLQDFGLKTSLFFDYERDEPFTSINSLGLPRSFSKAGIYSFYYCVKDSCGNSAFDKYSEKIYCRFYVTDEGTDDEDNGAGGGTGNTDTENEPGTTSPGSLRFVLHRKY